MAGNSVAKPVDVKPIPRAIIQLEDPAIGAHIEGLFPYEEVVEWSASLHDPDWDVMISDASVVNRDPRLFVVAFGSTYVDSVQIFDRGLLHDDSIASHAEGVRAVRPTGPTSARDLLIPEGLPSEVERLVRSDLVPGYEGGQPRQWLQVLKRTPFGLESTPDPYPSLFLDPFLLASDGSVLAGRVRRSVKEGPRGECWIVPSWVPNPRQWVKTAWRAWHEGNPASIPKPPDWADSGVWDTADEARLDREIRALASEKEATIAELDAKLAALHVNLANAREEAARGPRRLLTGQGAELVAAAKSVLEDLGFEVEDMDEVHPQNDRREDLRVRTRNGFEAIAEVRGYKGGAQSNDLLRLGRFAGRYQLETGAAPAAQWYIVNELLSQDAGTRPVRALMSKPAEVEEFGQCPGAVISSVALYRIWQRTAAGEISADAAQQLLLECRGYLDA